MVNGSHWHMIKGLKPGTSYKVRVVARDPNDPTVHSTDEVLVAVPGEVACLSIDGRSRPPFLVWSLISPSPPIFDTTEHVAASSLALAHAN